MQIEMILCNICQNSNIIVKTMDPVIIESMTGSFYDQIFTSGLFCSLDESPENKWRRGGHLHIIFHHFSIDGHIDCRKHSNSISRLLKPSGNNIRSGCLSLCSSDPDDNHILGRISGKPKSQKSPNIMVGHSERTVEGDNFSKKIKHRKK